MPDGEPLPSDVLPGLVLRLSFSRIKSARVRREGDWGDEPGFLELADPVGTRLLDDDGDFFAADCLVTRERDGCVEPVERFLDDLLGTTGGDLTFDDLDDLGADDLAWVGLGRDCEVLDRDCASACPDVQQATTAKSNPAAKRATWR